MNAQEVPPLRLRWAVVIACFAVTLSFFAIFRVDLGRSPLISFRYHERWQSKEALALYAPLAPPRASPATLSSLASLFAAYAMGPEVRKLVVRGGPLHGSYRAFAGVRDGNPQAGNVPFPLVEIRGTARSRTNASYTAARVSSALRAFLTQQQDRARIPMSQRSRLYVVASARGNVERIQGRRLVGPLAALTTILVLLALATISERRRQSRY